MFATYVNCVAVVIGSLIGLLIHRSLSDKLKEAVFISIGLVTLVIGIKMSLESGKILILALSLVIGGLIGHALKIENGIFKFGELLNSRFGSRNAGQVKNFPVGFLNASVLFCVGAMTIIGAFKAGTERSYELLLTKSVMDGFMAILLTASYGIGVAFSVIPILVYQGGLTLLSRLVSPYVNEVLLAELSAVGGTMIIMIGLNLLKVKEIKTANFLPALVLVPVLLYVEKLKPF